MKGRSKVGLALAGGGPGGAIYEVGAIRALDEAIEGIEFTDFDVYIGVSAGAFLASHLANNISTAKLCRGIIKTDPGEQPFVPEMFLTPAYKEYIRSGKNIPRFLFDSLSDYLENNRDPAVLKSLTRMSQALPVGLFNNDPIRNYIEKMFTQVGAYQ